MIGKLLCKIGLHRWQWGVKFFDDRYHRGDACKRCGARRVCITRHPPPVPGYTADYTGVAASLWLAADPTR